MNSTTKRFQQLLESYLLIANDGVAEIAAGRSPLILPSVPKALLCEINDAALAALSARPALLRARRHYAAPRWRPSSFFSLRRAAGS